VIEAWAIASLSDGHQAPAYTQKTTSNRRSLRSYENASKKGRSKQRARSEWIIWGRRTNNPRPPFQAFPDSTPPRRTTDSGPGPYMLEAERRRAWAGASLEGKEGPGGGTRFKGPPAVPGPLRPLTGKPTERSQNTVCRTSAAVLPWIPSSYVRGQGLSRICGKPNKTGGPRRITSAFVGGGDVEKRPGNFENPPFARGPGRSPEVHWPKLAGRA